MREPTTKKRHFSLSKILLKVSFRLLCLLVFVSTFQVALLKVCNPPFTMMMAADYLKHKVNSLPYDSPAYVWTSLDHISVHLRRAVIAAEDQRFLRHNGFDFIELQNAAQDVLQARRIRGASTITMQAARMVYLSSHRNVFRKSAEIGYTFLIELIWDKRRILEIYLNTVDWGDKIVGAEAAARKYFNRSAQDLTPRQAALLAAILPNPHMYSPVRPSKTVRERVRQILRAMPMMPLL